MSERIEFLDLSVPERQIAARIVAKVGERLPWERVEAVFQALGRAEWLIGTHGTLLYGSFPRQSPTLLRNERLMAAHVVFFLQVWLDDEAAAQRVIEYLAQRGAALDALFIHEAAAMSLQQRRGA